MEDRVITIQDVIDAGACRSGVLKFVAEHGVLAMPASRLAALAEDDLTFTPLDGFGDGDDDSYGYGHRIDRGDGYGDGGNDGHGDGNGFGYGYGSGDGYGEGYGDCYGDGNGRGGGGDGGMR